MKRILQIITLILFSVQAMSQQDVHFSQFYELPLLRNPALAGVFTGNVRMTAAYRNQWESVTTPYRTMALGMEYKVPAGAAKLDFVTAGLQITNDVAGDSRLKRTQVLPVVNYHKMLNEENLTYLSMAIMGGPVMEGFDRGKLSFDDQFVGGAYTAGNPTKETFSRNRLTYWDASAGMSFNTLLSNGSKMYIGFGMFHLTSPKVAFMEQYDVRLNRKWVINAGYSVAISDYQKIVAYVDYFKQGGNSMIQAGFLYNHSLDETGDDAGLSIAGGAAIRWKDAIVPVVRLKNNQFALGVSYDVNTSKLKTASLYRGGFEMTLSYTGIWNLFQHKDDLVECPKIGW